MKPRVPGQDFLTFEIASVSHHRQSNRCHGLACLLSH